jgi:hypothetical protein
MLSRPDGLAGLLTIAEAARRTALSAAWWRWAVAVGLVPHVAGSRGPLLSLADIEATVIGVHRGLIAGAVVALYGNPRAGSGLDAQLSAMRN